MHINQSLDFMIVGGGVGGLWAANALKQRGYSIALLDGIAAGGIQTLASQGIIHGGIKYSLNGFLSPRSDALSSMPNRWRKAILGRGEIDLKNLLVTSNKYHMFATNSIGSRLSAFLSQRALHRETNTMLPQDFPEAFNHPKFIGKVIEIDELVIDIPSLIQILYKNITNEAYRYLITGNEIELKHDSAVAHINGQKIQAKHLLLCAGVGNASILDGLGMSSPKMQLRPLQQVGVYKPSLPEMFAHCITNITSNEPRLTITTHKSSNRNIWYLGGRLASAGAAMSSKNLRDQALKELRKYIPWVNWNDAQLMTFEHDRAEPIRNRRLEVNDLFLDRQGPVITCWPIKLSLIPRLEDLLSPLIAPPRNQRSPKLELPKLELAKNHWDMEWNIDT
ncbi:MAG: hypothetical protein CMD74_01045 [Gammaproteobacteria bacterium]|nr:hypothetical protein [Gammaproteobacteria bacterium]